MLGKHEARQETEFIMPLVVHQFGILSDNFGVLVHDAASGATASIDAGDDAAIEAELAAQGWRLTEIWVTHHHADHVAGVAALKKRHGATVIAPRREADRIEGVDRTVGGGDAFHFAGARVEVIDTPGHTAGHIAYVIPSEKLAFVGDTLFAMGCGRVIEGTTDQMWASLSALRRLPGDTLVYCGHEYTLANARFAVTVDPDNAALKRRLADVERLRAEGRPTLPTTIGAEIETNPFLRADRPEVARAVGLDGAPPAAVFAEVRARKNRA
jgi:hydroxyacylglutathione hydrolase